MTSRDLFDSHKLLKTIKFDITKLRLAFTIYAGMEKDKWENININKINLNIKDIIAKLVPVLKNTEIENTKIITIKDWATNLIAECKEYLQMVLPFKDNEIEFLEKLQNKGEIDPTLITDDKEICNKIKQHPSLKWRTIIKTSTK